MKERKKKEKKERRKKERKEGNKDDQPFPDVQMPRDAKCTAY